MKKLLLSLGLAVGAFFSMSADTATVTFSTMGYSNAQAISSIDVPNSPIKIAFAAGGNNNAPSYYTSGTNLRIYTNNTMTVSVPEDYAITEIKFTASSNTYAVATNACDKGTITVNNAISTWKGSEPKIVFTKSGSGQFRLTSIEFTYSLAATAVDDVNIDYTTTATSATVTLTCPTDGATIYYGFAPGEVNNVYTAPFTVNKHETVYAYAEKGADKSNNSSLSLPYFACKEVLKAETGEDVVLLGNYQVLSMNDKNLILTDGVSNVLVYGDLDEGYTAGTKISKVEATASPYNSLFELSNATLTEGGEGAEYTPVELTSFEGINYDDNLFDQVVIKGCTISGKSGKAATLKLNEETIALYNTLGIDGFENGENYDVTGYVWRNHNNLQIVPLTIENGAFVETVKTPVIAPNKRELMPDDDITITCATADVEIHYTTDGTDPDENSPVYSDVIDFPEDVVDFTVKAIAYYVGEGDEMLPSEIAERTYHLFDPTCNILTSESHEGNRQSYTAHTCTIDRVDYQMVGMHGKSNSVIQMNNSSSRFCYIIQTSDNKGWIVGDGIEYFLSSIEVAYNDDNNGISFNVRGSNTPFTASLSDMNDKGNIQTNGEFIGTISSTNTKVEFDKNYRYFAFYPANNGAVYLDAIAVNYRSAKDSPKLSLTGAYLEADANTIHEQYEAFLDAYNADGDELDLTGDVAINVTDAESNQLVENEDYVCEVEGNMAVVAIREAGVYTVTMTVTGDLNYEDGSLSTELTVYSPVAIADQTSGVTYSCGATPTDVNGTPALVFAEGARDHAITLNAPAGAKIHYRVGEVAVDAPANAPAKAAALAEGQSVPKGFKALAEDGALTLPGEHGALELVTEKNGVVSPSEKIYYTNDANKLDIVLTGVAEIEINEGTATYYDLNGRRVAAEDLNAGVYVRVAGKTVTKVLVK